MEAIRAPQIWNLYDFAARLTSNPRTAVLDFGFNDTDSDGTNDHPTGELSGLTTYINPALNLGATVDDHGQHVAGIVGATWYNSGV